MAGRYREPHALRITTGASPWGFGEVLEWWDQPIAFISEPISDEDLCKFGIVIGDCRGQGLLETLALHTTVAEAAKVRDRYFCHQSAHGTTTVEV